MKKKNKFLTSPFWMFGIMFLVVICYFSYIFVFIVLPSDIIIASNFTVLVLKTLLLIFPTLILIGFANKIFSIVTISDDGIHKALFGHFFKQDLLWHEIKDVKVIVRFDNWLFISKTSMNGLKYEQLQKNKKILQMSGRPEIYKEIERNTNLKIR